MDLVSILGEIENRDEIIKAIEKEIGKNYVSRVDFNEKNDKVKMLDQQVTELTASLEDVTGNNTATEQTIADLTSQINGFKTASLKARIANELGIPYELSGRLTGEDEETLRQDAQSLVGFLQPKQVAPLRDTEPVSNGDNAYKSLLNSIKGDE